MPSRQSRPVLDNVCRIPEYPPAIRFPCGFVVETPEIETAAPEALKHGIDDLFGVPCRRRLLRKMTRHHTGTEAGNEDRPAWWSRREDRAPRVTWVSSRVPKSMPKHRSPRDRRQYRQTSPRRYRSRLHPWRTGEGGHRQPPSFPLAALPRVRHRIPGSYGVALLPRSYDRVSGDAVPAKRGLGALTTRNKARRAPRSLRYGTAYIRRSSAHSRRRRECDR